MMNGCNKLSDNSKQAKRNDFRKLNNKKLDQRRLIACNSIDGSYNGSCTNSFRSSRQTTSSGYYSMLPSARERIENQHIFQNHYKYLCELNNSVPKVRVKQDQLLEFYGDRIRCEDWSPIINAIENDQSLRAIKIHNYYFCHAGSANDPALHRQRIMKSLITALQKCLLNSKTLCILYLEAVPFSLSYFKILLKGIENNENLQHVAFPHCSLGNEGCELLCRMLRYKTNIKSVDLSGCGITAEGALCISQLIQVQKLIRYGDCWKQSLRYRQPNPGISNGLYILILDNNTNLCDSGFDVIISSLLDDLWISEVYCKNCGLTNESVEQAINLAKSNNFVKCIDLRKNLRIDSDLIKNLERILLKNHCGSALSIQQNWNSETDVSLFPVQKKSNSSIVSNVPRSYSSGNQSSMKETNNSFRFSESNNTDVCVPPLRISSLQRNHDRKNVYATKQTQLSELHKVKKELIEAKNKMYDEIGKRKAAEKYCEQLEIQLKRQDNCVLIEKPLLEKLIQTFQEFSCSLNDVVKLDEFTNNVEDKKSTINEDVILNLESSILNLSIGNKNKVINDNTENLSNLKETLQDGMKLSLENVNSLVLDPKRKAQDIYNQILKNYLRNNSVDQEI